VLGRDRGGIRHLLFDREISCEHFLRDGAIAFDVDHKKLAAPAGAGLPDREQRNSL